MANDLIGGRGSKKSGLKSPVAELKAGVGGKKGSMKMMPRRKMRGKR